MKILYIKNKLPTIKYTMKILVGQICKNIIYDFTNMV